MLNVMNCMSFGGNYRADSFELITLDLLVRLHLSPQSVSAAFQHCIIYFRGDVILYFMILWRN